MKSVFSIAAVGGSAGCETLNYVKLFLLSNVFGASEAFLLKCILKITLF